MFSFISQHIPAQNSCYSVLRSLYTSLFSKLVTSVYYNIIERPLALPVFVHSNFIAFVFEAAVHLRIFFLTPQQLVAKFYIFGCSLKIAQT